MTNNKINNININNINNNNNNNNDIKSSLYRFNIDRQSKDTKILFKNKLNEIILAFAEKGLNIAMYNENENPLKFVSVVPTSAITGEGIPDLIETITSLCEKHMKKRLAFDKDNFESTVLEVKNEEGHGTTVDAILSNGVLSEGDRVCFCGFDGPVVTTIKNLLVPQACKESRARPVLAGVKQVKASLGVKIVGLGLEKVICGTSIIKIIKKGRVKNKGSLEVNQDIKKERVKGRSTTKNNQAEEDIKKERVEGKSTIVFNQAEEDIEKERVKDRSTIEFNQVGKEKTKEGVKDRSTIEINQAEEDLKKNSVKDRSLTKDNRIEEKEYKKKGLNNKSSIKINQVGEEEAKKMVMEELNSVLKTIDVQEVGVHVQASTLGSLEALLLFLKGKVPVSSISIGNVRKKDVIKTSIMTEKEADYAVMLCFDIKIDKEMDELAGRLGVRIFSANIIYHLLGMFDKYLKDSKERKRNENSAVFPCKLKIIPNCVWNKRSPIVMGVEVEGILTIGSVLVRRDRFVLGRVTSIENNKKSVTKAVKGDKVAIKVETEETPRMFGRHFAEEDIFYSNLNREQIDVLQKYYREDLTEEEWRLVKEIEEVLDII